MKIIRLVLHIYIWVMSRAFSRSTLLQNSFIPHELQKSGEMNILQIRSCENLADLFMKSLPASSFYRDIHEIGMRRLRELHGSGGDQPQGHNP